MSITTPRMYGGKAEKSTPDPAQVEREAYRYAVAGVPVLPVSGKLPVTKNGLSDATRREKQIGFWFRTLTNAGIGLACGHELRSGGHLLVLDVDVKYNGDYELTELEEHFGEIPQTWTVRTPSGGWHYYFRTAEPCKTRVGFRSGLELRGVGAYVVAPPSPGYTVEAEVQIAECPDWLLDVSGKATERGPAPPLDEIIPEGKRDNAMASLAGTLRRRGLASAEILACLEAVNENRCHPPLPLHALARIAASVASYPAAAPLVEKPAP